MQNAYAMTHYAEAKRARDRLHRVQLLPERRFFEREADELATASCGSTSTVSSCVRIRSGRTVHFLPTELGWRYSEPPVFEFQEHVAWMSQCPMLLTTGAGDGDSQGMCAAEGQERRPSSCLCNSRQCRRLGETLVIAPVRATLRNVGRKGVNQRAETVRGNVFGSPQTGFVLVTGWLTVIEGFA
jgi:hypothetical protein